MSIIKNDSINALKSGDHSLPHHIIVVGITEEIGLDLATLAKNEYGAKLEAYNDPIHAKARQEG